LFLEEERDYGDALYMYQKYEELFGPSLASSLAVARLEEKQGRRSEACDKYREISRSGFSMDQDSADLIHAKVQMLCQQGR